MGQLIAVAADDALVLKGFRITTKRGEPVQESLLTNDAKIERLHRRSLFPHRYQQMVDVFLGLAFSGEHFPDSDAGQAGPVQDFSDLGATRQTAEFRDKLAHSTVAILMGIGGEQTLKPRPIVPAWRRWISRHPLDEIGIGGLVGDAVAVPVDFDRRVRI